MSLQSLIDDYSLEVEDSAAKALENIADNLKNKNKKEEERYKKLLAIADKVVEEETLSGRKLYQHQKEAVKWLMKGSRILAIGVS